MSVAVVYLDRSINNSHWSRKFYKSLLDHDGGAEAELIVIRKGDKWPPRHIQSPFPFRTFDIPDEKYTLGSIRPVIEQLTHEKFVFFHSFSKILAPNWLKIYLDAFKDNVGIVGATGSLENNAHIRTNAFMMDRKIFLELMPDNMLTRDDEAIFESGSDSLTKRIISRGLKAIVVDKNGLQYQDFGAYANIFRRGYQEDLLIADNRTYDYDISPQDRRQWLWSLAWGLETFGECVVPETTLKQRVESYIGWNYDLDKQESIQSAI